MTVNNDYKFIDCSHWIARGDDEMYSAAEAMLNLSDPLSNRIQIVWNNFFTPVPVSPPAEDYFSEEEMEEETVEGSDFTWQQVNCSGSGAVDYSTDEFTNWLEQEEGGLFQPQVLNCLQGVAYYLCRTQPQHYLREEMWDLKNGFFGLPDSRAHFYANLPDILGLSYETTTEMSFFALRERFKQGLIKPYTLIAFGEPRGEVHVTVVTKDLLIRSLWLNPGTSYRQSSFGKYEPEVALNQAEANLRGKSPVEIFRRGLKIDACYLSTKFCSL